MAEIVGTPSLQKVLAIGADANSVDITGLPSPATSSSATNKAYVDAAVAAGGAVASVFGRTGVITAQSGDYTTAQVSEVTNLYYTDVRADARITAQKGLANGLATLDASGLLPSSQLPAIAITSTFVVASQVAMLALTAQTGDVAVRTDLNESYILQGTDPTVLGDWIKLLTPTDTVLSVNGQTGSVVLTTTNIAEGTNLYATNARTIASTLTGYTSGAGTISSSDTVLGAIQKLNGNVALLAPLASPTFTGTLNAASGTFAGVLSTASTLTVGAQATATSLGIELGNYSGGTPFIDFKNANVDYHMRMLNSATDTLYFLSSTGTGTVGFTTRIVLDGNQSFSAASANAHLYHDNINGLVMYGAGSTYDVICGAGNGDTVFAIPTGSSNMVFFGDIFYNKVGATTVLADTVDGSDNKAITMNGGGAYGVTRGSGIACIGNEYATVGGDLELLAGDSSISGAIKFYVGDGASSAILAGRIDRTTGALTMGTTAGTGTRAIYAGALSINNNGRITVNNTNESTTLTDFTQSITNAGYLINTEYTANAYTAGLFWATSNDNATVPKAGVWMRETGAGTLLFLGTSNNYASGISSSISIDQNGSIAVQSISANTSGTYGVVGGTTGSLVFNGSTSGAVTLSVANTAGTWTMKLPTSAGSSGQVLQTDGSGNTTWATVSGGSGATTALDNLASVAINAALVLGTSDAFALGSTTKMWSDLFLASGAVINFNAGDVTITHSANKLVFDDATNGYEFVSSAGSAIYVIDARQSNSGAGASGSAALRLRQGYVTTTNFKKMMMLEGVAIYLSDGTSPNGSLSGNAGDLCLNGSGSQTFYCTGTTTWTAM